MTDKQSSTPDLKPPPIEATQNELSEFIWARNRKEREINTYNRYDLENFLGEMNCPEGNDALKDDYITGSIATQLHQMNATIQFLLLRFGRNELKQVTQMQRRYCETVHLLHKIKMDNLKLQSKSVKNTSGTTPE
ncbi:MAG: hypothetical protein PHX61_10750 [Alphaproteobacteria bacterium]|nr:hypothetical protein [Alphaproteobacteria bacterium]